MAVLVALLVALVPSMEQAPVPAYDTMRAAAIATCDAIDESAYQTGLAFNPDGYRSYYVRSECLQRTAVQFRDVTLCDRVRQRRAIFSSSWGYSPANCRTLVARAVEADRTEIAEIRRRYTSGAMRLRDVRIERNGNGRDYDVVPVFEGTAGDGYTITIEISPPGGRPVVVHTDGYYVDPRSALRIFIRRQEIAARVPAFAPGRSYQVRVTATLSLAAGGGGRFLSDAFLEGLFPLRERMQSVSREIRF